MFPLQALSRQIVVEPAKGLVREALDVSIDDALVLLRTYARTRGQHLTDVSRALVSDREARPDVVAALRELHAST